MRGSDLATQQTAFVDALIIGGGFTGLSAADHLRARGHSVHVLEQGPTLGGLARTIAVGGEPIESYYHHIFPQDTETIELIDRLGLGDRLEWRRGTMAVLHRGVVLPLDSPLDLLRFRPLGVGSRLRVGMAMSVQLLRPDLRALDERYAAQEVRRWFGRDAYEML
jgi:protoporphyrinogen oxidase